MQESERKERIRWSPCNSAGRKWLTCCAEQDSVRPPTRPCGPCPSRSISIMSRSGVHATALPGTISSAGWAAAHDTVRRQPVRPTATPFTDARKAPGTMMEVQVERDLVFAAPDGSELALDIYRAPQDDAPVTSYLPGGGWRGGDKAARAAA